MSNQAIHENPTIEDEQQLRRINQIWTDALVRGDTATLNTLMDEGCVFGYLLDGDDRAQFLADIESGELRVDSLKRENVEVNVYCSTGVIRTFDTATWRYKGQKIHSHYRVMEVFAKRDGEWQIVALQISPISLK